MASVFGPPREEIYRFRNNFRHRGYDYGDLNKDGRVDDSDLTIAQRFVDATAAAGTGAYDQYFPKPQGVTGSGYTTLKLAETLATNPNWFINTNLPQVYVDAPGGTGERISTAAINKVAGQIADQRNKLNTSQYYGGDITAIGGIDATTNYMASLLVKGGIQDISEIAERQVDGGKQLYNKTTGQPLPSGHDAGYVYANSTINPDQNSYIFGGTFAGGNTSLNISMVDGKPVFYTSAGPSSATFSPQQIQMAIGVASLMFPGVTQAIGSAVAGAIGATVTPAVAGAIGSGLLTTIATEGDVKQGLITAATSLVASNLAPGAEAGGYGGAGDVLASDEVIGGIAGYGGAGDVLAGDELLGVAPSGVTDVTPAISAPPDVVAPGASNVIATLDDGSALVSDAAGNLSVIDAADVGLPNIDNAAVSPDALDDAALSNVVSPDVLDEVVLSDIIGAPELGAEGFANMGPFQRMAPDNFMFPQQNVFLSELGQVGSLGQPNLDIGFEVVPGGEMYSPEFMGPRPNVIATLDDGSQLVADAAGNLSVVDAGALGPEVLDANLTNVAPGTAVTDAVQTGLVDEATANAYLDPSRPVDVQNNGVISQTFDDGSTIKIDASGNVTVTDAADALDNVPINREVILDSTPVEPGTQPIDADGVKIDREVTLDAEPPAETRPTGPIDADGVTINREVTLDATPPDSVSQSSNVIDADGVPINREVTIEDIVGGNQPTTQVFDDGSTLVDTGGNLSATPADTGSTVVQTFDDGSAIVMDSNGNLSATPSVETNQVVDTGGGFQTFDDGSTFQTFDDGSTLAVDSTGNVTSTPAVDAGLDTGLPANTGLQDTALTEGNVQTFDDGSTLQTFDDGSVIATDVDGNVVSTTATDTSPLSTATLQDTALTEGTVQTFDDGSTLQTFDDGSTIATDADGNVVTSTATDVSPFQIGTPDTSLTDKIIDYVTSNPLTTAALLAGATGLAGGEEQQQQTTPKKTYTYQPAPTLAPQEGLEQLFRASESIYGPPVTYTPPKPEVFTAPEVRTGPLLFGRAPGAGLPSLIKTLPTPQTIDINKLTPEQLAAIQQMVSQGA